MTFLEMVQLLREEVGANGTGPAAVAGQTGEYGRLVRYLARADEDVQRKYNEWKFMRGNFSLTTTANIASYSPATIGLAKFRDWRWTTFKIRRTVDSPSSETELPYIDYQTYLDINIGANSPSMPQCFTVGNAMELLLWPMPNEAYTITGEYQKAVTTLTADADVPAYPSEYHMLAVYRAMMSYGRFTAAQEVYNDGRLNYRTMLKEMSRTQLPRITMGDPLV